MASSAAEVRSLRAPLPDCVGPSASLGDRRPDRTRTYSLILLIVLVSVNWAHNSPMNCYGFARPVLTVNYR